MAKRQSKHGRAQRAFPTRKSRKRGVASGNGLDAFGHRITGSCAKLAAGGSFFGIPSGKINPPRGLGALEPAYLVPPFDRAFFETSQQSRAHAAEPRFR